MKYDDIYITELSRAAIFSDTPFIPKQSPDWAYIHEKSVEQNITGLVFDAVSKLPDEYRPCGELFDIWQQEMFDAVAAAIRQYNEFLKMSKKIADIGIKAVVLKGGFMRGLYPVPELRTMGDFDILIQKTDLPAVTKLFKANGYEINKAVFGIEAQNENAFWELFYVLEEEFINEPEKNTRDVYEHTLPFGSIYVPGPTLFFAHMVIHTGKHYVEKGAGIRNLLDIALYIKKYAGEIDFKRVEEICREQNYSKIYNYILNVLTAQFGMDISFIDFEKTDTELFMEYTLLNGVFGRHDNVLLRQMALDERENSHGVVRLLFPPVKTLETRYKYLKKFPFLLPVAWIQRVLFGIFVKKVNIGRMFKDIDEAVEFSDERLKWLGMLDLKDEH